MTMAFVLWIVFGLVTGAATIALARALDRERALLGGLLVGLGIWYLVWGVADGRSLDVLAPQILGGVFFSICGVSGLRASRVFLAIGWTLHAGWDFASPLFSDVSYMPSWTAPACLGYDLLLGGYLFRQSRQNTPTAITEA